MGFLSRTAIVLFMFAIPHLFAQEEHKWEIGGAGGWSFAKKNTVSNNSGSADAGLNSNYLVSAAAVNHMFNRLSGEIRYVYRKGDLSVKSGGTEVEFTGETHSVGYELLLQISRRESRVRPYVAFGGGVRVFRGTGTETDFQPLEDFAVLSATQETQPMFSIGGGVSVRLAPYAVLRLDFRDQVTPFPKKVILPAPGADLDGFLHDFMPMVGIGLTF